MNHVTSNLSRLRDNPTGTQHFISQMGEYFVAQQYSYHLIQQLMSQISGLSEQILSTGLNPGLTPSIVAPIEPQSQSVPNSPTSNLGSSMFQTSSHPGSPQEPRSEDSMNGVPTLRTESTRVLVEFESPSEWYRALEMIRSVEAHRAKMRASGGKSRKPPIEARLL